MTDEEDDNEFPFRRSRDLTDMFDVFGKLMNSNFTGGISRRYSYPSSSYGRQQKNIKDEEKKIDITEDDEHIYATIDLSEYNIPDDNLNIKPNESSLVIEYTMNGNWYRRTFELPSEIDPITSQITYKNSILDAILDKVINKEITDD